MTVKEDQKLLTMLRAATDKRPIATLETVGLFEPLNTPQLFVSKGKLYQPAKSQILNRVRALNKTQSSEQVVLTAEPSSQGTAKNQLIVDLSMITLLVARRKISQNVKDVRKFFDLVWKEINCIGSFLRIDIVADNYQDPHPLKNQTRKNRGTGTTVSLQLSGKLPKNFSTDFLSNAENKDLLYELMTQYFVDEKIDGSSVVYVITHGRNTLIGSVPNSNLMEADYRLTCHILDGLQCGFNQVTVRGNDTDIVIILMAFFPLFVERDPTVQLRMDFNVGKSREILDLNRICLNHGMNYCRGLLFFHAFTGCDYTPSFFGIGIYHNFENYY